jgi:hypothetical protein
MHTIQLNPAYLLPLNIPASVTPVSGTLETAIPENKKP